jgi:hypothetical protein
VKCVRVDTAGNDHRIGSRRGGVAFANDRTKVRRHPRPGKAGGSTSPTSATVTTFLPTPPTVAGCSPCHGPPQPTSAWTPSRISNARLVFAGRLPIYNMRRRNCISKRWATRSASTSNPASTPWRIAQDLPPQAGLITKLEFEYRRHGTISLFGNLHVPTGHILKPMHSATRTEDEFLKNLDNLISHEQDAHWRLIVDNLNTHCSESYVLYVAAARGLNDDLSEKGVRGVLKNRVTR